MTVYHVILASVHLLSSIFSVPMNFSLSRFIPKVDVQRRPSFFQVTSKKDKMMLKKTKRGFSAFFFLVWCDQFPLSALCCREDSTLLDETADPLKDEADIF